MEKALGEDEGEKEEEGFAILKGRDQVERLHLVKACASSNTDANVRKGHGIPIEVEYSRNFSSPFSSVVRSSRRYYNPIEVAAVSGEDSQILKDRVDREEIQNESRVNTREFRARYIKPGSQGFRRNSAR